MINATENNYLDKVLNSDYVSRIDSTIKNLVKEDFKESNNSSTKEMLDVGLYNTTKLKLSIRSDATEINKILLSFRYQSHRNYSKVTFIDVEYQKIDINKYIELPISKSFTDKIEIEIPIYDLIPDIKDNRGNFEFKWEVFGKKKIVHNVYYNTFKDEFSLQFTPGYSLGPIPILPKISDTEKEKKYKEAITNAYASYYDKFFSGNIESPFLTNNYNNIILLDYSDNEKLEFINLFKKSKSFKAMIRDSYIDDFNDLSVDIEYQPIALNYNNGLTNQLYFNAVKKSVIDTLTENPKYDVINSKLITFFSKVVKRNNSIEFSNYVELIETILEHSDRDILIINDDYKLPVSESNEFKVLSYFDIDSIQFLKSILDLNYTSIRLFTDNIKKSDYAINITDDELKELDKLYQNNLISDKVKTMISNIKSSTTKLNLEPGDVWDLESIAIVRKD